MSTAPRTVMDDVRSWMNMVIDSTGKPPTAIRLSRGDFERLRKELAPLLIPGECLGEPATVLGMRIIVTEERWPYQTEIAEQIASAKPDAYETNRRFVVECSVAQRDAQAEMERATARYGLPASTHESLGVLLEEFTELQAAIHANALESVREEAIQVAAVALRLAAACRGATAFKGRSVP
jgi:NTP pyrophosphatase (non-canonical NTP hydrolase)